MKGILILRKNFPTKVIWITFVGPFIREPSQPPAAVDNGKRVF